MIEYIQTSPLIGAKPCKPINLNNMFHHRTLCRLSFLQMHLRALPKSSCCFRVPHTPSLLVNPSNQSLPISRRTSLGMRCVYLDANATIYFVEKVAPSYQGIRQRMTDAAGNPTVHCVFNELLLMEVRVKSLREQDRGTLGSFVRYFAVFARKTAPMAKLVFELATQLRVSHNIKTPDAMHLAAVIHAGCDQFWTNDNKLIGAAEGRIEVINVKELHDANT